MKLPAYYESLSQPQQAVLHNERVITTHDQEQTPVASIGRNNEHFLIAYQVSELPLRLEVAPKGRAWMEETRDRFIYRCLPLLMSNQCGWVIVTSMPFRVLWDGSPGLHSITIESLQAGRNAPCISHFGEAVLTFQIPWVFYTPRDYSLLVKGPANMPKDGASPLEGVCETFWACATFTMNWRITRPRTWITWEANEPIAQLLPLRIAELEQFQTSILPIESDPELAEQYQAWANSRGTFNANLARGEETATKKLWEKDYFHGTSPGGASAPVGTHKTKLRLCPFAAQERKEGQQYGR